jgi:hypothetical protein
MLQRNVYRNKKIKTQTTCGNQTNREQVDNDKEQNNANQNKQRRK